MKKKTNTDLGIYGTLPQCLILVSSESQKEEKYCVEKNIWRKTFISPQIWQNFCVAPMDSWNSGKPREDNPKETCLGTSKANC